MIVLLIRIICMKNHKLVLMVFLCSFFIGLRTYYYVNKLDHIPEKVTDQVMKIQGDSIKVDGNFLKLTGKIQGEKYLVYYSLKTSKEKAIWERKILPNTAIISGETEAFDRARNLNGFDAQKYYQSLGFTQILRTDSMKPFRQKQFSLSEVRQQLIWQIDQRYSKRVASYVKALVIGYKDSEFAEYTSAYKTTGLLHLFTLSGLHIQFYLGGFHLLLKRVGLVREMRLVLLSLVGFLLIFLTGGSFSTIRAIFSFLIAFACVTGNFQLSKLDQWSIMLFLVIFCFPLVFWSVGAQLSIYFALILLYLNDLKLKSWQQALLFAIFTLPLLIYNFSEWTIIGGLLTILLFPFFEWLILPGCLILFFGCFFPLPGFLSFFMDLFFQILEKVLESAALPNLTIGRPDFFLFLLLILLVLLVIDRLKYQQKIYWFLVVFLFLILSISFSANGLVAFVDVGQGDSIFIKLPFKQETFLIDTGGQLNFKQKKWQARQQKHSSDYNLLPFLKSLGCTKIDHLLITHNDADHMGELLNVLNKVKVKNLYLAKGSHMELKKLLQPIKGTKIHLLKKGDTVGKKLKLQILSPESSQGENNDSLVTYFNLNQQRFLLTGDLEITGEEVLLKNYPQLKIDFLKIGHHGSNTSTSETLLKQMQPKYAIISVGNKNRYGHPTQETLTKLKRHKITVFRTDQQGMIYYQWSPITKRGELELLIDFLD